MHEEDNEPNDFSPDKTFVDYFYLFIEKLWLVVIFLIIGLVFAQRELSKIPTTYRSKATIEVLRKNEAIGDITDAVVNRQTDLTGVVAQKLSLNSLFIKVAESPEFAKQLATYNQSDLDTAKRNLAVSLREVTSVRLQPRSPLIDIVAVHTDAQVARDVVAVMLREYVDLGTAKQDKTTDENLDLLQAQIGERRKSLATREQALVIYREALKIRSEIQDSKNKIREMEKSYLPKWPRLVQEKKHRDTLAASFSRELNRITNSSDAEYAFWDDALRKAGSLSHDEARLKWQLQAAEARNNMLDRDYQTDSKLYENLSAKLNLGNVEKAYSSDEISILENPELAKTPVKVNKSAFYLKYAMLGTGAGMMLSFFLGSLDTRIRRIEDLERLCNTEVLAAIPKSTKLSKGLLDQDQSLEYEAFRTFHTNSILKIPSAKVVLLTSATPGEGKSTVSCNLAAASASWGWGEKVLLIDLDLRKPRVHQYIGLPDNTKGVGDYLIGKENINDCIKKHPDIPELYIMPGGSKRFEGNLPEMKDLEKMLELFKKNFDRIIIDSAPILAVSDTLVLAHHADEVCVVFRMWKTPRKALIRALSQLSQNKTYPFGIVANAMPARSGLGRNSYYYSYSGTGYQSYATPDQAPKPAKK